MRILIKLEYIYRLLFVKLTKKPGMIYNAWLILWLAISRRPGGYG
jgi:hypothetical protein